MTIDRERIIDKIAYIRRQVSDIRVLTEIGLSTGTSRFLISESMRYRLELKGAYLEEVIRLKKEMD